MITVEFIDREQPRGSQAPNPCYLAKIDGPHKDFWAYSIHVETGERVIFSMGFRQSYKPDLKPDLTIDLGPVDAKAREKLEVLIELLQKLSTELDQRARASEPAPE